MPEIDFVAVLVAGLSAFMLGGLWYSPILFADQWMALTGLTRERLAEGSKALLFGGAFALSLAAAFVFAMFLGPDPRLRFATAAGLAAGLGWVATSFGISYLFERRPFRLGLINGGYHILQFTLYGIVLGALS